MSSGSSSDSSDSEMDNQDARARKTESDSEEDTSEDDEIITSSFSPKRPIKPLPRRTSSTPKHSPNPTPRIVVLGTPSES